MAAHRTFNATPLAMGSGVESMDTVVTLSTRITGRYVLVNANRDVGELVVCKRSLRHVRQLTSSPTRSRGYAFWPTRETLDASPWCKVVASLRSSRELA